MKKEYEDSFLGFISQKQDRLTGAYKLVHVKTGKFYVGSTNNFYERRIKHMSFLRQNKHHSQKLQDLYNEDPHFKFEFFYSGKDDRARTLAYEHEQMLLDEYSKSDLLLNSALDTTGFKLVAELAELRTSKLLARNKSAENRSKVSERMKEIKGTREFKAEQAEKAKAYWQDPEYRKKKSRRIMIDGVEYGSIKEASEKLKIHPFTIGHRLKNKKKEFDHYKYLD